MPMSIFFLRQKEASEGPLWGEPWMVTPEVNTPDTFIAQDPQPAFYCPRDLPKLCYRLGG